MTYIPEPEYLRSLAGRSVALVGAAASVAGTGLGDEVEAHDVVARTNWTTPVPDRLQADIGVRTDVLYHVLTWRRRLVTAADVAGWAQIGVGLLVATRPAQARRCQMLAPAAARAGLWWTACETAREQVKAQARTAPNTGLVAVTHLLSADITHLTLYGFDWYRTGHWLGQRDETPHEAAAQAGGAGGHSQRRQRRWMADLVAREPRLRLSPPVAAALR